MNTKNILKTLALAMLLIPACNKSEIANEKNKEENTEKKGFALPVTVNVTREGDDATKATYNESTRKLEFSAGDKLFVYGSQNNAGKFAGTLDYDAVSGKFSGTVTTQYEYTGTIDNLMETVSAFLLPAGYESYGFYSVSGSGYEATVTEDETKAFALTKAAAVEQFSYEVAYSYSSGFALAPMNAIVSFTISGLTANKEVAVSFNASGTVISGKVTTNATGVATFAVGVCLDCKLENCTLTVDGNNIAMPTKTTEAGHIYNITRSAIPGALIGKFSVSSTEKVYFSKGNLQLVGDNTWKFADNQWDYFGNTQSDNHRDLFGWGTKNNPNNTSENSGDYSWNEWGENTSLVSALGSGWRTLTSAQWTYLLNTREGTRYCKATVNSVSGLVIFPDSYSHPTGVTAIASANTADAAYTTNSWSGENWTKMETAGAVFLPAAGFRFGTPVDSVGSAGHYWSSTPSGLAGAYFLHFYSGDVFFDYQARALGLSVRLVRDAN